MAVVETNPNLGAEIVADAKEQSTWGNPWFPHEPPPSSRTVQQQRSLGLRGNESRFGCGSVLHGSVPPTGGAW